MCGIELRRGHHRVAGMGDHHADRALSVKRGLTGQQVVGHRPERVDVASLVELVAAHRLLGRHEERRAKDLALIAQIGRDDRGARDGPARSRAAWPRRPSPRAGRRRCSTA